MLFEVVTKKHRCEPLGGPNSTSNGFALPFNKCILTLVSFTMRLGISNYKPTITSTYTSKHTLVERVGVLCLDVLPSVFIYVVI